MWQKFNIWVSYLVLVVIVTGTVKWQNYGFLEFKSLDFQSYWNLTLQVVAPIPPLQGNCLKFCIRASAPPPPPPPPSPAKKLVLAKGQAVAWFANEVNSLSWGIPSLFALSGGRGGVGEEPNLSKVRMLCTIQFFQYLCKMMVINWVMLKVNTNTRPRRVFFFSLLKPEFSWTSINCFNGFLMRSDREAGLNPHRWIKGKGLQE